MSSDENACVKHSVTSQASRRRGAFLVVYTSLAIATCAALLPSPSSAATSKNSPRPTPSTVPELVGTKVRMNPDLSAGIDAGPIRESLIVAPGLRVKRLKGRLEFPWTSTGVVASIRVDGIRVALVPSTQATTSGTVEVDVALPDEVADQAANEHVLQFSLEAFASGFEKCLVGETPQVHLKGAIVLASGNQKPPASIAEFVADPASNFRVWSASAATDPAAVQVVASLTHRNPNRSFDVRRGRPPTSNGGSNRGLTSGSINGSTSGSWSPGTLQVEIIEGKPGQVASTQLSHDGSTLTMTGTPVTLMRTARALGSNGIQIADGPQLSDAEISLGAYGTTTLRFGQLTGDPSGPKLETVSETQWTTSISQSRFGGPVSAIALSVHGRSTPVPTGGSAEVSLLWNGSILATTSLVALGQIDFTLNVPTASIARDNTLALVLRYGWPSETCRSAPYPIRVDIDANSTITATAGQTLAEGFARFPQVLRGEFRYASDAPDPLQSTPTAAALIAAALQRLSPGLLSVQEVPVSAIHAGRAGVIVDASAETATRFGAPFQFGSRRVLAADSASISFEIPGSVGAIQAFQRETTDLVIVAGTTASESTQTAEAVVSQPDGWYRLSDQLELLRKSRGARNELVAVPLDRLVNAPETLALRLAKKNRLPSWLPLLLLVLMAIVLVRVLIEGGRMKRLRKEARILVRPTPTSSPPTRTARLERRRRDRRNPPS